MPVFNDKLFLIKALDSLLSQSFRDFELIISDDCSTDGSGALCEEYAKRDPRIVYIRQTKNIGISRNMEFLLKQAKGKYFMWAANDDYWHKDFILTLKAGLDGDPSAVTSFCAYCQVDEHDTVIPGHDYFLEDYADPRRRKRLSKLIDGFSDGFGYGLFVKEKIAGVKFPVWWWINKKCAYNNIYPTLCFYLAKGGYIVNKEVMWYNRLKEEKNVNHKIPYHGHFLRGFLAFTLRKFNLVTVSAWQICRAQPDGFLTAAVVLPKMMYKWFLKASYGEFRMAVRQLRDGKKTFI
ncbi:MAG TPA: glycosyltransferase family A protein [Puia sp.]|uniref:glycosyltransferase family 2 protein n=1 Tax=Puia sp. TaxID=2045100 RepID=UPI002C3E6736|nr:glycosyltransferase family A protein [Puia sp.]HVU98933.1 glycosyltransferase family A protein [Puia sp.]